MNSFLILKFKYCTKWCIFFSNTSIVLQSVFLKELGAIIWGSKLYLLSAYLVLGIAHILFYLICATNFCNSILQMWKLQFTEVKWHFWGHTIRIPSDLHNSNIIGSFPVADLLLNLLVYYWLFWTFFIDNLFIHFKN